MKKKYDEELVLRFLYLHKMSDGQIIGIRNFQDGLEEFSIDLALNFTDDYKLQAEQVFRRTFDQLIAADKKILGRWDSSKQDFKGGFLNSSFEALAISLGYLLHQKFDIRTDLRECAIEFWNLPQMTARFATGKSTEARLSLMVPAGREIIRV